MRRPSLGYYPYRIIRYCYNGHRAALTIFYPAQNLGTPQRTEHRIRRALAGASAISHQEHYPQRHHSLCVALALDVVTDRLKLTPVRMLDIGWNAFIYRTPASFGATAKSICCCCCCSIACCCCCWRPPRIFAIAALLRISF